MPARALKILVVRICERLSKPHTESAMRSIKRPVPGTFNLVIRLDFYLTGCFLCTPGEFRTNFFRLIVDISDDEINNMKFPSAVRVCR